MSNSSARQGDYRKLHTAICKAVKKIRDQLNAEGYPFEVFEAFRTPERQRYLYKKGRFGSTESKVTWVNSWKSMHQYGLAVDFVLKPKGQWSWDDKGANAKGWRRMHKLAKENGMTPLYSRKTGKLIEQPHIQLVGITTSDMYKGEHPAGGDQTWAQHLANMIAGWSGDIAPPPVLTNII